MSPNTTPKRINLNDLLVPITVELNGKELPVKPVSGRTYQALRDIDLDNDPVTIYAFAKQCLPTLTEDEVMELTPTQVRAVLAVASENLSEVEALFPNPNPPTE